MKNLKSIAHSILKVSYYPCKFPPTGWKWWHAKMFTSTTNCKVFSGSSFRNLIVHTSNNQDVYDEIASYFLCISKIFIFKINTPCYISIDGSRLEISFHSKNNHHIAELRTYFLFNDLFSSQIMLLLQQNTWIRFHVVHKLLLPLKLGCDYEDHQ